MIAVRNKRGRRNMEYLISFLLMLAANIASGLLLWLIENKKPRRKKPGKHERRD